MGSKWVLCVSLLCSVGVFWLRVIEVVVQLVVSWWRWASFAFGLGAVLAVVFSSSSRNADFCLGQSATRARLRSSFDRRSLLPWFPF
jgi:hypothetical protein